MALTSSTLGRTSETVSAPLMQVYFTHCLPGQSVRGDAGYSVRGATPNTDPALLDFAFKFTPYELPLDMWGLTPKPTEAPRRLALVLAPNGLQALVQTSYLPEDTRGRKHSYFTHFIFCPKLSAVQALATWGSTDWKPDYSHTDPKELPALPRTPRPGPLNEQALTAFLRGDGPVREQDLASITPPARLPRDTAKRQDLLLKVLHGCLLALRAGAGSPRGRFYILAEPGLTALLLYGAARLLPPGLAATMTFSTYENMHSALRAYRLAQVVGTYQANASKGLDADYYTSRGYALDTFTDKFSPDLLVNVPRRLEDLIALAALGDWPGVDYVQQKLGGEASTLNDLGTVLDVIDAAHRLAGGQASDDDLIALRQSPWGEEELQRSPQTWQLVLVRSPGNERLRQVFRDMLAGKLKEIELGVTQALVSGSLEAWQTRWRFCRQVIQDNGGNVAEAFTRTLPPPRNDGQTLVAPALRLPLLQEWLQINAPQQPLSPAVLPLLTSTADDEIPAFWRSGLPHEWVHVAAISTLLSSPSSPLILDLIRGATEPRLTSFLQTFKTRYKDSDDVRAQALVPLVTGAGKDVFGKLLRSRLTGSPTLMHKLLTAAGAFDPSWSAFWRQDTAIEQLFMSMEAYASHTQMFWDWLTNQINAEVVVKGDPSQRKLLDRLETARETLGPLVPAVAAEVIADWVGLRRHFDPSYKGAPTPSRDLHRACERRQCIPLDLLKTYFKEFVLPRGEKAIAHFESAFHGFVPKDEHDYQKSNTCFVWWLKVVNECKDDEVRAGYQQYYLDQHIAPEFHMELAQEAYNKKRLEKRVLNQVKKVHEARLAAFEADAEAAARRQRTLDFDAPSEGHERPMLNRSDLRQMNSGGGKKWVWLGVGTVAVAVVVGLYIAMSGSGTGPSGEKRAQKDDSKEKKDERERSGTKDKASDAKENIEEWRKRRTIRWSRLARALDQLKKIQKDLEETSKQANELPSGVSLELLTTLNALKRNLRDKAIKPMETMLQDEKALSEDGWNGSERILHDMALDSLVLADQYRAVQKKVSDAKLKEASQKAAATFTEAQKKQMKEEAVREWIAKQPAPVLAGLLESHALYGCGLSESKVRLVLRKVFAVYVLASFKNSKATEILDPMRNIRTELLKIPFHLETFGDPSFELTADERKQARANLRKMLDPDNKDGLYEDLRTITNAYAADELKAFPGNMKELLQLLEK